MEINMEIFIEIVNGIYEWIMYLYVMYVYCIYNMYITSV